MPTITIREGASSTSTEEGFAAEVVFSGGGRYPISVTDPFDEKREQELEWYFERWLERPHLDEVKANRAKESIREYGETLFGQVFADGQARGQYEQAKQTLSQLQIEIEGSPAFQALHWEALREPQAGVDGLAHRPLVVDCVMVRRQNRVASTRVNASPVVNLLVVVARPDEENDVGYRTISRPLVEAVGSSSLRVNVDILRPGTYEALVKQLDAKGEGYYHVVHFDMHGCLASYEQLLQTNETAQERGLTYRLVNTGRYGRDDLEPFKGVRAFLSFEGEAQGERDFVEASELAGLLKDKRIPVCLLNACQSGKQIGAGGEGRGGDAESGGKEQIAVAETSLGSRLMAAGMQVVVAMGYSVTVSAAKVLMETLYARLFADGDVVRAIRQGRYELYARKQRRAYFNREIALEDWLLPVVYANGSVDLNLRELAPEEEEQYLEAADGRYAFAEPTFGFVGRDLEILKIEKALLRRNVLLLRGMGGTGKTTLLNYLREWWPKTHFVEEVFYFGYDEKAHTLQQILQAIGKRVYGKFEFAQFQAMSLGAQRQKLAKVLKAKSYALVLDNLESVTGQSLAIMNTLPEEEQREIEFFLQALMGGQTKVVLGSRGDEAWLEEIIRDSRYQLRGLDRESRTVLAEKILEKALGTGQRGTKKIAALRADKDFERLMKLLDGYPLAMEVVLANLARQNAGEIVAGLDAADVALDSGSANKTESILKCVEYSHSNLSAAAQKLLLCLAPFKGFIDRADLPSYAQQLQQLAPFADWKFELFEEAIDEAVRWGLLSPYFEGDDGRLLRIQPVFPYFLKTKLAEADEAIREGLATGFKEHYKGLAAQYQQMMQSKEPKQRELGLFFCGLEYENLFSALQTSLQRRENPTIFWCLQTYLGLSKDRNSELAILEFVSLSLEEYGSDLEPEMQEQIVRVSGQKANLYLDLQRYSEARESYQTLISFIESSEVDTQSKQSILATIYHQLGIVAQELRDFEQARSHFQQALDIQIEFNDRFSQASTYHMLGRVAQELRDFEQAQSHFQQALDIQIEFNDRYSQASTYHQLGIVAQELRDFEQAQALFQQALDIQIEFNDRYSQASTYHQLGRVAQELRDFEQARSLFQQALDIKIEFNDRFSQASTYGQLGDIERAQENYNEAKALLLKALEIFAEFSDEYSANIVLNNLKAVYQATQDDALLPEVTALTNATPEEVKSFFTETD